MSQYTLEQRVEFQELIKGKRQARGWNQTEAGDAAEVGQRNISELERGPSAGTPFLTIAKVAKAYGISLDYIATVLGIFDDNSVKDETGDFERRTGLTSDYFKLSDEEQARLKRLFNFYVLDRLHYSGGTSADMMPVKHDSGALEA